MTLASLVSRGLNGGGQEEGQREIEGDGGRRQGAGKARQGKHCRGNQ